MSYLHELHHLGNDREDFAQVRIPKSMIPEGATLVEAYSTPKEVIIMGEPNDPDDWPDDDERRHNCDVMGCGSLSHVLYRFTKPTPRGPLSSAPRPGEPGGD